MTAIVRPEELNLPLERTEFFNDVIRHLSGALQEVVGHEDAASFISVVGSRMGDEIAEAYAAKTGPVPWGPETIANVLVDLKARIGGDFAVESVSDTGIILTNGRCPFAENVVGRSSLCMMTTNVFGRITAQAAGYARVEIDEAIALGDGRCRVRVHLTHDEHGDGHEFYR